MKGTILIVEDDEDQLQVYLRRFTRVGYRVVGARHPRQALAAASMRRFHVAILDASLPEMDGFELMRRLRRMQDETRCVIVSAFPYPKLWAEAQGATTCLVKPCSLKLLEAAVEGACQLSQPAPCHERALDLSESG